MRSIAAAGTPSPGGACDSPLENHVERLAAAPDDEQHPVRLSQRATQIRDGPDRMTIDLQDDVAGLEPGVVRGASGFDPDHREAGAGLEAQPTGVLARERRDAQP